MKLITLGHGTLSKEDFAALIKHAGIQRLIDVRTVPKSRHNPQFFSDKMKEWVPTLSGAAYEWDKDLGGFRHAKPDSKNIYWKNAAFRGYADYMQTDQFAQAFAQLVDKIKKEQCAIMCSETLWWRCHRRMIADAVVLLAHIEVQDLWHDGKLTEHVVTPGARVVGGKVLYDVIKS
ncbi:MAG TPA: DUF488 domain-containing protein [Candidatus Babeliales bacterium]|nr:DUF488 domain-containing protein [Candidatus Babeliales bacterium]